MEIIEVTNALRNDDFSVKKFIKMGDNHYVEIQPKQKAYRIKISTSDYYKGLKAYYSFRKISCYPMACVQKDGTLEVVVYQMNIV